MLRDGPLLFDAVDRDAYVERPFLEDAMLSAVRVGRGILLTGPSGSGRTTLLNWIRRALQEEGRPVVRVDARAATDASTAFELIEHALVSVHGESAIRRVADVPETASRLVLAQARARRLGRFPDTVVLVDNLAGGGLIRALFGALRDILWETGHRWVVTAHPHDRAHFLAPPADAFFTDRIDIPPLPTASLAAFMARHPEAGNLSDPSRPRFPGEVVRELLHPELAAPDLGEVAEAVGGSTTAILEQLVTLNRPVTAEDEELAARTGLSPGSLRRHLGRLHEAGYVSRVPDRSGGPGRPRIAYLAARTEAAP